MRNVLWVAALLTLPASPAFARDALWLLCTGTGTETTKADKADKAAPTTTRNGIVVSLFDARHNAGQRLDTIDVLFRGRRFSAEILDLDMVVDQKARPAALELKDGKRTMFQGQIRVSLAVSGGTLSLTGKMRKAYDPSQEFVPFEATLACKDMSDFGDD